MVSEPIVSVLMTAYNREKYIGQAIESVLASTFSNLELIIVDDGSKDRTVEIAKRYSENDSRVKVYVNEKNLGDYPNRNKAASYATGKFLKYVDADDYIYPWGLQLMVEMMEQFPDAGWGMSSMNQIDSKPFPIVLSPQEIYEFQYLGKGYSSGSGIFTKAPLSAIIKREVFIEVGGFEPIRMAGDYDMWHRLGQKYSVILMPHGLVWYRIHGEQEMKHHNEFVGVYQTIKLKFLNDENSPLHSSVKQRLISMDKKKIYRNIVKGIIRGNMKAIKTNFELIQRLSS